jgi:hypothetical protein
MKHHTVKGGRRAACLVGVLLMALFAAQWVSGEDGVADKEDKGYDAPEEKSRKEGRISPVASPENDQEASELNVERFKRLEARKFSAQAGDIFRRQSWLPPPSLETKVGPPSAPPLPFKYLGRITDGDGIRVFLSMAERNYIVGLGDEIDGRYRVEGISDNSITLTYLPLHAKQMLSVGDGG